jgi:nitrogen fixation protein NifQ
VITADRSEPSIAPHSSSLAVPDCNDDAHVSRSHVGIATYRLLTGCDPDDAVIEDNADFDRHVLASIIAAAAMDAALNGEGLAERAGLAASDLAALLAEYFPKARPDLANWCRPATADEDDETAMVRDLLRAQRSSAGDIGHWLAAMVARRSMEPNHLWEDLGLRDRSELSRLLSRHFGPLAARNTGNMRWKRFFYRMLCEDDGFVMCTTPVCTQCNDFELCFGDESGESRMAERRREFLLQAELVPAVANASLGVS